MLSTRRGLLAGLVGAGAVLLPAKLHGFGRRQRVVWCSPCAPPPVYEDSDISLTFPDATGNWFSVPGNGGFCAWGSWGTGVTQINNVYLSRTPAVANPLSNAPPANIANHQSNEITGSWLAPCTWGRALSLPAGFSPNWDFYIHVYYKKNGVDYIYNPFGPYRKGGSYGGLCR